MGALILILSAGVAAVESGVLVTSHEYGGAVALGIAAIIAAIGAASCQICDAIEEREKRAEQAPIPKLTTSE